MHVRQRQQPFIFYVECVQHIQIIYYNICTYNLVINICNMMSWENDHSCRILLFFLWG